MRMWVVSSALAGNSYRKDRVAYMVKVNTEKMASFARQWVTS